MLTFRKHHSVCITLISVNEVRKVSDRTHITLQILLEQVSHARSLDWPKAEAPEYAEKENGQDIDL